MSSITQRSIETTEAPPRLPPLKPGDHMDQKTFHERYEAMPKNTRAELINGVVYMPSPLKWPHGLFHVQIGHWVVTYQRATPGTEAFENVSTILGERSEPQPDICLLILNPAKGQTRKEEEYVVGPPEFMVEVADSSLQIDLHDKRSDYERTGVKEYLVIALPQQRAYWFITREGKFAEMIPGPDGILRSEVFPGLWFDPTAFFRMDWQSLEDVLKQGLASPEHAAFVAGLKK